MTTHALTERAMVMNLSIGIWQGYRLDKKASQEITEQKGAAADAARVNKHLVPKEALASIVTASGAVRTHFYANTLPWRDNGDRLMTRKLYTDFIAKHEELVSAFNAEVEAFLGAEYLKAISQAEFRMGTMFDRADYPPVSDLRRRFYCTLDIAPVSTANDFRVQIDQDQVDRVKASIEAAAEARLMAAQADVWKRMADAVSYFHDRMADPKAVFRDSTVKNIAEIVDMVPGLNVLDDPDIERVRAQIVEALTGVEAKEIRKDPELRTELAGEAKQIMDTMAGFMRAFGGGQE